MSIGVDRMKCDVCQTNIPIGSNSCPNCGYKIKKEHTSVYDASGNHHNHIQIQSHYVQSRINNALDQPSHERVKIISKIALIVIVISIVVGLISSLFITFMSVNDSSNDSIENEYSPLSLTDLSYQEVIDSNEDDDGTVEMTLAFEEDIVDYLESHDYQYIEVDELVDKADSGLSTVTYIESDKGIYHYSIIVYYSETEFMSLELAISGSFDEEINRNEFLIEEDDIKDIAEYVGMDSAYSLMEDAHSKMKKNDSGYYYSDNSQGIDVYMSERYYTVGDPFYYFYYSVTNYVNESLE